MQNEERYIQFVIIASTLLFVLLLVAIADLLLIIRNKRLRHKNDMLEAKSRHEYEILKTRHEVTEQVFSDIAAELHDNIGQTLTLAVVHLNQAEIELKENSHRIAEIRDIIRQGLTEIRQLSHDISKEYWTNINLEQNIQRLADRVQRTGIMTPKFELREAYLKHHPDNEIILLRIVQELVQNSLKHSAATEIHLSIIRKKDTLQMVYSDNGKGIHPIPEKELEKGLGMRMIEQRLTLLQASWQIRSNNGYYIEAIIPDGEV